MNTQLPSCSLLGKATLTQHCVRPDGEARLVDLGEDELIAVESRAEHGDSNPVGIVAAWNLRRLRKQAGMSQKRLAELVSHFGLTWTALTVSDAELALERWAKGRRFTPDELVLLSLIFYVTPSELLLPPGPTDIKEKERIVVGNLTLSREEYLTDVLLRPSGVGVRHSDGGISDIAL